MPIIAKENNEEEEEEIEKRGTDSGYESDQRKSFSSSTRVEVVGASVSPDIPEVESPRESGERKNGDRYAEPVDRNAGEGRPHYVHPLQLLRPLMHHLPHPVHFPLQAGVQHPAVGVQHPAVGVQHPAVGVQHLAAGLQHSPAFQHPHVRPLMPQPAMYLKVG